MLTLMSGSKHDEVWVEALYMANLLTGFHSPNDNPIPGVGCHSNWPVDT